MKHYKYKREYSKSKPSTNIVIKETNQKEKSILEKKANKKRLRTIWTLYITKLVIWKRLLKPRESEMIRCDINCNHKNLNSGLHPDRLVNLPSPTPEVWLAPMAILITSSLPGHQDQSKKRNF
jgi:hypothetical protein